MNTVTGASREQSSLFGLTLTAPTRDASRDWFVTYLTLLGSNGLPSVLTTRAEYCTINQWYS